VLCATQSDVFVEGAYIAASGGIAAIVVMSVWQAQEVKRRTTYGSARWAEMREAIVARTSTDDPDNAGIRREPELPEHEEIAPEPRRPTREFELPRGREAAHRLE
jgi:hypothetical protein